jgi:hypothetical protein
MDEVVHSSASGFLLTQIHIESNRHHTYRIRIHFSKDRTETRDLHRISQCNVFVVNRRLAVTTDYIRLGISEVGEGKGRFGGKIKGNFSSLGITKDPFWSYPVPWF